MTPLDACARAHLTLEFCRFVQRAAIGELRLCIRIIGHYTSVRSVDAEIDLDIRLSDSRDAFILQPR
jgi:hypothetical protein